jgi:hypothetical protein
LRQASVRPRALNPNQVTLNGRAVDLGTWQIQPIDRILDGPFAEVARRGAVRRAERAARELMRREGHRLDRRERAELDRLAKLGVEVGSAAELRHRIMMSEYLNDRLGDAP